LRTILNNYCERFSIRLSVTKRETVLTDTDRER
jgi:hypothetical protein